MQPAPLSPIACAGLLVGSFVIGGACQSAWFAHPLSKRFTRPLDGGHTLRGRRLFGDNKTTRGFVVIVPATALAMAGLGTLAQRLGLAVWPEAQPGLFLLGAVAALGLMLGELPNSFVKRQLDVEPGSPPKHPVGRVVAAVVDRLDSVVGALVGASLVVELSWETALYCLLIGPPIHGLFSVLLWVLGVKKRAG
ncbi:CDP-archaeol synthase [Polyangium spumosum]|uniref:CDP-archaeol synthase n=1 Tax=Polyangium spumosum TaxID=889282 RepID=A0A6N7PIF0_9BACT|nr:CDP-archaeol synthase [Polyangium spumosum]